MDITLQHADMAWSREERGVLLAVLSVQFCLAFGVGSLGISLPAIEAGLGMSSSDLQWLVVLYQLGFATMLITGGSLGDRFGCRRMLCFALGFLALGTAVASLANTPFQLLSARLVQGAASGLAAPQTLALVQRRFEGVRRTRAVALYTSASAVGYLAGSLLTGWLIQQGSFGLDWRWGFICLLPAVVGAFTASCAMSPVPNAARVERTDWAGVGYMTVAILCVLVPLLQGRELGWPSWLVLAAAAALLAAWRAQRTGRRRSSAGLAALLDPELFAVRSFVVGCGLNFIVAVLAGSVIIWIALTLQLGMHRSPLTTAALLAVVPAAQVVGSHLSARAGRRVLGKHQLAGGATILAGAHVAIAVAALHQQSRAALGWLAPGLIAFGFGIGSVLTYCIDETLRSVPPPLVGRASSLLQSLQQAAGAVGIALLGLLYFDEPSLAGGTGGSYVDALIRVLVAGMAICPLLVLGHRMMSPPRERRPYQTEDLASP